MSPLDRELGLGWGGVKEVGGEPQRQGELIPDGWGTSEWRPDRRTTVFICMALETAELQAGRTR